MMTMQSDQHTCARDLVKIASSGECNRQTAEFVGHSINRYFSEFKRDQCFREADLALSPKFGQLLQQFGNEAGILFASQYFLFAYTLTEKNYKQAQIRIEADVAQPYLHWVRTRWAAYREVVKGLGVGEEMVFVCRHAVTQGMYAPGKSTYTFIKALLDAGEKVTLVSLGFVDDEFKALSRSSKNFTLARLTAKTVKERFEAFITLLSRLRPKTVITEVEFDIVSILAILKPQFPTVLLSAGFYNLPWYDKIGLTDTLADEPVGQRRDDFFTIPTYVSRELLDPHIELGRVKIVRKQLGFAADDLIIGSFARMEKFSVAFGGVLKSVLDRCPNAKVLLAGPNDQTRIRQSIRPYCDNKRALVFGQSDVQLLGRCVDIAVDTFPLHSGFSMLELMAKKVPVVSMNDEGIEGNWRQRLPELLCSTDDEMVELLCRLINDACFRDSCIQKTKSLMASQQHDAQFVSVLRQALAA